MNPTSPDNAITIYYNEQDKHYYLSVKFGSANGSYKAESTDGKQVKISLYKNGSNELNIPLSVKNYGDEVVIRGWLPYPKLGRNKPNTKGKITIKFEDYDEALLDRGGKG